MTTQKEALVYDDITVRIVDSPIPSPKPNEVLIKVAVSGSNPKDWYVSVTVRTISFPTTATKICIYFFRTRISLFALIRVVNEAA